MSYEYFIFNTVDQKYKLFLIENWKRLQIAIFLKKDFDWKNE